MDRTPQDETPTHEADLADGPAAGPAHQAPGSARKPYTRPRLTEHGTISQATLGPSTISDRSLKEGFAPVDPRVVLAAVVALPIERWSYKGETARHLGPMAQDFAAALGLGADDRHIFPLDVGGVALAAIQGLHGLAQAQEARLETLERELTALRRETAALRVELAVRETEPVA
jgi:endosialidase-like protein